MATSHLKISNSRAYQRSFGFAGYAETLDLSAAEPVAPNRKRRRTGEDRSESACEAIPPTMPEPIRPSPTAPSPNSLDMPCKAAADIVFIIDGNRFDGGSSLARRVQFASDIVERLSMRVTGRTDGIQVAAAMYGSVGTIVTDFRTGPTAIKEQLGKINLMQFSNSSAGMSSRGIEDVGDAVAGLVAANTLFFNSNAFRNFAVPVFFVVLGANSEAPVKNLDLLEADLEAERAAPVYSTIEMSAFSVGASRPAQLSAFGSKHDFIGRIGSHAATEFAEFVYEDVKVCPTTTEAPRSTTFPFDPCGGSGSGSGNPGSGFAPGSGSGSGSGSGVGCPGDCRDDVLCVGYSVQFCVNAIVGN